MAENRLTQVLKTGHMFVTTMRSVLEDFATLGVALREGKMQTHGHVNALEDNSAW